MRFRAGLVAILTVLLLCACAATGPKFQAESAPPQDRATVYVYRDAGFVGGGVTYMVSANGVEIARLPAGGYFVYHAPPGEVEFSAQTEAKTSVTLDARAGETYYVKGTIGVGFFVGHPHLTVVSNEVGAREVAACSLVEGANTEGAGAPGGTVAKQGPFATTRVTIAPADIVGKVATVGEGFEVVDRRTRIVLERTTIGHMSMSGVAFDPGEIDLIRAVVGTELSKAREASGSSTPLTCLVNEFSVTTPATVLYWDVTVDVALTLQAGQHQRQVKAHAVKRTYAWPSEAVIAQDAVAALKTIATESEKALREMLAAATVSR